MGVTYRKFDLNIVKILEDWDVCHAIREVIANALDEQILTNTQDIEVFQDSKRYWHIRDYGRGLRYDHLTQEENDEKLSNPHVIGKFGIGLKDALATFDRKKVKVTIISKHGEITLGKSEKADFDDVVTLHAYVAESPDVKFVGTDVILEGVSKKDIKIAKEYFLRFSGDEVLEDTKYGQVLEKVGDCSRIYVNGVRVSEEENFLFSYNITSLTKAIRKALNRERTNVGRTAYSDRVKAMLLDCKSSDVASRLMNDLMNFKTGAVHDELNWIDVQEHAAKTLSAHSQVVFFTSDEIMQAGLMVDEALTSGYEIITIPERLRERIRGQVDISGNPIRDLSQFLVEYHDSFSFQFVSRENLTAHERMVFNNTDALFDLIDGKPKQIREVLVSETMRKDPETFSETTGVWESEDGRIIVKRTQLKRIEDFAGTLLHETAHAKSGAPDFSRSFEHELTKMLGLIASKALEKED